MSSRIAHWLGVTGPSYNIDTACSSSHFAIMEAYRLIQSGECDAAIVVPICASILIHNLDFIVLVYIYYLL